ETEGGVGLPVGLGAGVPPAPPPLAQIHIKSIRQLLGAEFTRLGQKGTDVRSLSLAPQGRQPCRGSFARARFRKGSWVVGRSVEHHDPSASEPPEGKEQSQCWPPGQQARRLPYGHYCRFIRHDLATASENSGATGNT